MDYRHLPLGLDQADQIAIKSLIEKHGPRKFKRMVRAIMIKSQVKTLSKETT